MDINRIRREITQAAQQFSFVEIHKTNSGEEYVKTALQPASQVYIVDIYIPDDYPNSLPKVFIFKPSVNGAPHMYNNGNICYMHPSKWNPGIHNLGFVIARAAKWLSKYEVWKTNGKWPGASIAH